jgi:hypothetical protein
VKWETEEEFCQWIRAKWGDAYADNLEERVEAAVTFPHTPPERAPCTCVTTPVWP